MASVEKARELLAECEKYSLEGTDFAKSFPVETVAADYNGVGPGWLWYVLRLALSCIYACIECIAFIHDIRFAHSDGTRGAFVAANSELKRNGFKVAEAKFGSWDPRRYAVEALVLRMYYACRFFGWSAFCAAYAEKNNNQQTKQEDK